MIDYAHIAVVASWAATGLGVGLWLAARRLHAGKFNWASSPQPSLPISTTQLGALVLGLPWQQVGHTGAITLL